MSEPANGGPKPSDRLREARASVVSSELTGAALRRALVDVADEWLRDQLGDEPDVALVAVGGYGRRDPAPGSDLDLMLVHRGRRDVKEVADRLWYPIWDAGIGLDHSVRTVDEGVAVARDNLKAMHAMLSMRHVVGDRTLTDELRAKALAAWRRDVRKRLPELLATRTDALSKHGELAFLLEPDLKEAYGGLRDVHAMTAIAAAWLADAPDDRVRSAESVLLDARGELHRRSGRATERLVLQEQAPVAAALGYRDADELMRAVSSAGRTIAFAADERRRRAESALQPTRRWRSRQPVRRPIADGVVEQDGEAVLARGADPDDPVLLLRLAAAAAQSGARLAPQTLARFAGAVDRMPDPWPHQARDAFVALLGAGTSTVTVMEALDQAGLLVRLLPEWERVRCRPQRNPVHRFTVDRHLVEAAAHAAALTRQVSRPDLLLLAALLHDIGKGWPGDHTDAGVAVVPTIGARLGVRDRDIDVLVTLVRHHLLLPDTATRRDLDEPATVQAVADAVRERATLDLLHALTVADGLATGPAAWSEWKASLVEDLVRRTAALLEGEPPPAPDVLDDRQRALAERGELGVDVDGDTVTIVAPDRPGLLWRWAGVLALHRLEIRAATATSVGSTAVTVFDVSPRFGSPPDWNAVRADVRRAYDDALAITAHLAERERAYRHRDVAETPPAVLWIDDASHTSSVVEVRAHDRIGLLHRLTRVLAEQDLDVRSARMSTLGADVVDAFYVVDRTGAPVTDPFRRAAITDALLAACRPVE